MPGSEEEDTEIWQWTHKRKILSKRVHDFKGDRKDTAIGL